MCLFVCDNVCLDDLAKNDRCHTNNSLQVYRCGFSCTTYHRRRHQVKRNSDFGTATTQSVFYRAAWKQILSESVPHEASSWYTQFSVLVRCKRSQEVVNWNHPWKFPKSMFYAQSLQFDLSYMHEYLMSSWISRNLLVTLTWSVTSRHNFEYCPLYSHWWEGGSEIQL